MREEKFPSTNRSRRLCERVFYTFEELSFICNHPALNDEEKRLWFYLATHTQHTPHDSAYITYNEIAEALDEELEVILKILKQLYKKGFIQVDMPLYLDPIDHEHGDIARVYQPLIPDPHRHILHAKIKKVYQQYHFLVSSR